MSGSRVHREASPHALPCCRARCRCRRLKAIGLLALLVVATGSSGRAADELDECRQYLRQGEYLQCLCEAGQAIEEREYSEDWPMLKAQAELNLGHYRLARETIEEGLQRYEWSVRLRLMAYEACRTTNDPERAVAYLIEIGELASRAPWRYTDQEDLVAVGRAALLRGVDAREVLEQYFDRPNRYTARHRDSYVASGQLALDKGDFQLAAEVFQDAAKQFSDDADVWFGLARALASSDSDSATKALQRALQVNPHHTPSLLYQAEQFIDAERYDDAERWIQRVLAVNPRQPEAWAFRAVLARLDNDPDQADTCRAEALSSWTTNPIVDYLIGKKLAQKYRFAEGAACQRRALQFDPTYLPARLQLAQDLLRLGDEDEGWRLADSVAQQDGYDVVAFNLMQLRDTLSEFATLENDHFRVRMESQEARVYGTATLALLNRARQALAQKYGTSVADQVTVEIFPDSNDFAVRTFGMPGASGYLGVCFGHVITANSPVSQREHPSNWHAMLWHEFCHVITLRMTHNRIPRWLSEGISVYEERVANAAWGQAMTPSYRQMILDGEMTPVSQLSSAFLSPPSPRHLQFAYFESALVVEFIVDTYGFDALKRILHDLGHGSSINKALEKHTTSMAELESAFEQFATQRAENLAPKVDWQRPDRAALVKDPNSVTRWIAQHPNSFVGLMAHADQLIEAQQWHDAEETLKHVIAIYPAYTGEDNAYEKLAHVYRQTGAVQQERAILERYAVLDADCLNVDLRLLELATEAEDWKTVFHHAQRVLAVDPMTPIPYRALARAASQLDRFDAAIQAYAALLALDPGDPAEIHYRLALLLRDRDRAAAKRHVLLALEEAPRFRAALSLLLQLARQDHTAPAADPSIPKSARSTETAEPNTKPTAPASERSP